MSKSKVSAISASVVAALAPSIGHSADMPKAAQPASPAPAVVANPFDVSVEGGLVFSDYSQAVNSEVYGGASAKLGNTAKDLGGYGSISIGRKIENSDFDWKVGASVTQFMDNKLGAGYNDIGYAEDANLTSSSGFQSVDLDLGHRFNNGMLTGRVFAGVRAMHEADKTDINGSAKLGPFLGSVEEKVNHQFYGAGPRVGADVRFGQTFGFVSSVSAAAIYGQHQWADHLHVNYSYSDGYNTYSLSSSTDLSTVTEMDWMTDLTGSVGASYKPSENMEFVVGYRAEKLQKIQTVQQNDELVQGPFVRFDVKF